MPFRLRTLHPVEALALLTSMLMTILGCAPIPRQRYALDRIEFTGNEALDDDELREHIASRQTPRFAGLIAGFVDEYEVFDRYVLERDLERIERYYRARGYYQAKARAARVFRSGKHVNVVIEVEEGPPVLVRRVDVHGLEGLDPGLAREIGTLAHELMRLGQPFEEDRLGRVEESIHRALTDRGYAYAGVESRADVDVPNRVAAVGFWAHPGKHARIGKVSIVGLGPIPVAPVVRALDLTQGEPYARSKLDSARQAVLDLGVFSSVRIEPDLPPGGGEPEEVPLRVTVELTKLRSVRLGGGVELDSLKSDVHLSAGWEDRNFLGGFRSFLIEAVPGLVLYPTHLPTLKPPQRLLPQGRLRSELRQPGFLESRTTGVVRAQASLYPLILGATLPPGSPILGYRELRGGVGVERNFSRLSVGLSHNLQQDSPFAYAGALDPDLVPVFISYPELVLGLELTDKRLRPHRGLALRANLQTAGLGGQARDVKLVPDVRAYVPLGRPLTLATRASIGLLFPANYGSTVLPDALTRSPGPVSRRTWVRDSELMFLRGLFAGGPGSNRGYGTREIGPHGIVPFYAPGVTSTALGSECAPSDPSQSSACDLPLGGFTLWEASVELRYPIVGDFSGVLFGDAADVSPRELEFRFARPHLGVGFGLRYDTPVGPVRFDAGYRVPGLQAPSAPDEGRPEELFGLPIALSFGIGEAF